jgi:transposase
VTILWPRAIVLGMGNPKGVKRDFEALERRRLQAAKLFEQGLSQAEVARKTNVSRESTRRWYRDWQNQGKAGLKQAGRAGRKPRLQAAQLEKLRRGLKQGAEVLGYGTGLWTSWRVADLIERQTGQKFHPGHVWRILRSLGWSCQRPTGRAIQRNEPAIRRWKKVRWPEIKKKPASSAEP